MDDRLNTVAVLRGHLEEIARTLAFAEGAASSHDLEEQYRKMATLHRPSPLTKALGAARERLEGYLAEDDGVPER